MELKEIIPVVLLGALLLLAVIRIFRTPLKLAVKLLLNTALGFLALWLLRCTASLTGITLGLNLWNAMTVGILGLPGFVLLLLLQWVL